MEGEHQHGGNEGGSGDGDIDVAFGGGQDQHESEGDFNPILFQEATFASGDKNKAVRFVVYLVCENVDNDSHAHGDEHQLHANLHRFQGEGDGLHPRPWSAWLEAAHSGGGVTCLEGSDHLSHDIL